MGQKGKSFLRLPAHFERGTVWEMTLYILGKTDRPSSCPGGECETKEEKQNLKNYGNEKKEKYSKERTAFSIKCQRDRKIQTKDGTAKSCRDQE